MTAALDVLGTPYVRIDTDLLGSALTVGYTNTGFGPDVLIENAERPIDLFNVRTIWNRRPVSPDLHNLAGNPEARDFARQEWDRSLMGALRTLKATWLSSPAKVREAGYKIPQLGVAQRVGFTVPRTLVTCDPKRLRDFRDSLAGPVLAKIVSPGPPLDVERAAPYMVFAQLLSADDFRRDEAIRSAPAIYQEYVEKAFELRVTVVGNEVFACAIHSQATDQTKVDWRRYDLPNTPHMAHELDPQTRDSCRALVAELGLLFGTVDLVVSPGGAVTFLEINPNGQWGWIEELTGLPIAAAVARLLTSTPA